MKTRQESPLPVFRGLLSSKVHWEHRLYNPFLPLHRPHPPPTPAPPRLPQSRGPAVLEVAPPTVIAGVVLCGHVLG